MKILAAAAKLESACEGDVPPHQIFTGKPRFDRLMAIDYALSAATECITAAGLTANDIDLIVTASISTDHLSDEVSIMGPRLCHPLQRELGADNAMVFDVHDACWVFTMDVAQSFLQAMDKQYALIVRAECLDGIDLSEANTLQWHNGSGALLIQSTPSDEWVAGYRDITGECEPARVELLDTRRRFRGKHRSALYFTPTPELASDFATEANALSLEHELSEGKLIDPCEVDVASPSTASRLAPFALPLALSANASQEMPDSYISFDPFRMRVGACRLPS